MYIISPAFTRMPQEVPRAFFLTHPWNEWLAARVSSFTFDGIRSWDNKSCVIRGYLRRINSIIYTQHSLSLTRPCLTIQNFRRPIRSRETWSITKVYRIKAMPPNELVAALRLLTFLPPFILLVFFFFFYYVFSFYYASIITNADSVSGRASLGSSVRFRKGIIKRIEISNSEKMSVRRQVEAAVRNKRWPWLLQCTFSRRRVSLNTK